MKKLFRVVALLLAGLALQVAWVHVVGLLAAVVIKPDVYAQIRAVPGGFFFVFSFVGLYLPCFLLAFFAGVCTSSVVTKSEKVQASLVCALPSLWVLLLENHFDGELPSALAWSLTFSPRSWLALAVIVSALWLSYRLAQKFGYLASESPPHAA